MTEREFAAFNDYQNRATRLAIYRDEERIIYPALGLASEAGEVLSKIKKQLRDYAPTSRFSPEANWAIADEIGDVLWYLAALCHDLGTPLEVVAARNLEKLNSRLERGVLGGSGDNR